MVTSIVLTGMYKIGISANNKIKTPDGTVIELSDIPFVRYRFDSYGDAELNFIIENKKRFPCVHVMEINLDNNTEQLLEKLTELDNGIAKMIYVDITDEVVSNRAFSDEVTELLENIADFDFDRLNLRDKSTSLFNVDLAAIKKEVKEITGIKEDDIGVCGGPMCFINGNACLTAVKAREMLANYSDSDDLVVPSANHEGKMTMIDDTPACVNKCGCIRYHVFSSDTEAPAVKGSGSGKKVKVATPDGEKKVAVKKEDKKPKAAKPKGYVKINW